ncbi:hypothetical protein NEAUS07_0171 [Nematocida ausubeli]|nr:hypothetical protein NEAUS07_0171 [Nematocida ausubeli]
MRARLSNAVLHILYSITPQEQIENINIWRYTQPNEFLTWDPYDDSVNSFKIQMKEESNPPHTFQMRYFAEPQENPIKDHLPVNIWTSGRQSLGLCNQTIQPISYNDAAQCTSQWVFAARESGGFYIKPYHNENLCINNFHENRVRIEKCQPDIPSMAFLYGTRPMRTRFLLLSRLLGMGIEKGQLLKNDISNIISTGRYMYEPALINDELLDEGTLAASLPYQARYSSNILLSAYSRRESNPYAHPISEDPGTLPSAYVPRIKRNHRRRISRSGSGQRKKALIRRHETERKRRPKPDPFFAHSTEGLNTRALDRMSRILSMKSPYKAIRNALDELTPLKTVDRFEGMPASIPKPQEAVLECNKIELEPDYMMDDME